MAGARKGVGKAPGGQLPVITGRITRASRTPKRGILPIYFFAWFLARPLLVSAIYSSSFDLIRVTSPSSAWNFLRILSHSFTPFFLLLSFCPIHITVCRKCAQIWLVLREKQQNNYLSLATTFNYSLSISIAHCYLSVFSGLVPSLSLHVCSHQLSCSCAAQSYQTL